MPLLESLYTHIHTTKMRKLLVILIGFLADSDVAVLEMIS